MSIKTMIIRFLIGATVAALVAITMLAAASRMGPTAVEQCVDDLAAEWQGNGPELWAYCEALAPQ